MPLDRSQREYVISSVVDILRHRHRSKLLGILESRLRDDDYDQADATEERELDRVVLALAKSIDEELEPGGDR